MKLSKFQYFLSKHQNNIFHFILIFSLITLMMPPNLWNGNEEQYLGYAWRKFGSEDIAKISALRDTANHRFVFEYLTGFSIKNIGFEWTHALGRIVVTLLYSTSLVFFFKNLKLSITASCVIILTFFWLGESILGGEWLFRGFEPKTLAYPFVFFSFSSSLQKKFSNSYLLLVLATYFHFLVGGFWFLITCLAQLYWTKNFKQTLIDSLKYFVFCTPLFLIIAFGHLHAENATHSTLSANWIYSYFRAPHHVAPFASKEVFVKYWFPGIILLSGLTTTSALLYRSSQSRIEKEFSKLILTLDIYFFLSLLISFFDKQGVLGKFYLFRPASVTLFLTLCLYALFIKNRISNKSLQIIFVILIIISCLLLPSPSGYTAYKFLNKQAQALDFHQIFHPKDNLNLEQIIRSSKPTDIFLIDPDLEKDSELIWNPNILSFERRYDRPTLVLDKFVPSTDRDVLRWYKLLAWKNALFRQGCPSQITKEYRIRYLLAAKNNSKVNNCGKEIYHQGGVKLIEMGT
jgi:hypothetical protein